jgi:hypothetical protein
LLLQLWRSYFGKAEMTFDNHWYKIAGRLYEVSCRA